MSVLELRPKLRWPLDVSYVEDGGQRYVVLRDPLGIAPEPAIVPAFLMPIVARFDAMRSLDAIAKEASPYGYTEELVVELYGLLNGLYLLDTPESQARKDTVISEFKKLSARPMSHAAIVYPTDVLELDRTIASYQRRAAAIPSGINPHAIAALMLPHIDYNRGWQTYGVASKLLCSLEAPDVIVLMGTAHQMSTSRFILSNKDFITPYGALPLAREYMDIVAAQYGTDRAYRDEFLHKQEHSLDLQLPFLGHAFLKSNRTRVMPILVGSFYEYVETGTSPSTDEEFLAFRSGMQKAIETMEERQERVLFICGVDLAHVGRNFGDAEQYAPALMESVERADRALLDLLSVGDAEGLFKHIAADCDKRKICGFPTLYTLLDLFSVLNRRYQGKTLEYRQAINEVNDCNVTFAAMCWETETQSVGNL